MADIEKLKKSIEDGIVVYQAIQKDLKDGNLSLIEGASLVLAHGGKAVRLISSLKEIGEEIKDLDGEETKEIVDLIAEQFGGSEDIKEAIALIAGAAGNLNQGIQKLIAAKKES